MDLRLNTCALILIALSGFHRPLQAFEPESYREPVFIASEIGRVVVKFFADASTFDLANQAVHGKKAFQLQECQMAFDDMLDLENLSIVNAPGVDCKPFNASYFLLEDEDRIRGLDEALTRRMNETIKSIVGQARRDTGPFRIKQTLVLIPIEAFYIYQALRNGMLFANSPMEEIRGIISGGLAFFVIPMKLLWNFILMADPLKKEYMNLQPVDDLLSSEQGFLFRSPKMPDKNQSGRHLENPHLTWSLYNILSSILREETKIAFMGEEFRKTRIEGPSHKTPFSSFLLPHPVEELGGGD